MRALSTASFLTLTVLAAMPAVAQRTPAELYALMVQRDHA